ncbi:lamin tail domain-containing protein [Candidatus Woesearchaeota archaeon]|nr:lamin tail domain-containing protein [Candidatus Woesearchaeota archaeon]
MASNPEYEFKKLNDLLCTSFNNIKYDVRDINGKIENLKHNFASFSTDSIKTAFEAQTSLIKEQQQALNQLSERLTELENRPARTVEVRQPADTLKKDAALQLAAMQIADLKKVARVSAEAKKSEEPSVYDIPEGEIRITKVNFKSDVKGKGNKKLNGEWVEITGYGVDLTGFKLHDKGRKHTFKFPEGFTIYGPIKIFTGRGRNTNTKLYWGRPRPVWNDKGDVATLKNKQNKILSQVVSEPTYSFKTLK